MYAKLTKDLTMSKDLQIDKTIVQREPLYIAPKSPEQQQKEYKQRAQKIIEAAPEASSSMAELISRKIIVPKYSDLSGNKEKSKRIDEKVETERVFSHFQNEANKSILRGKLKEMKTNQDELKKVNKESKKKMKKEALKAYTELDKLQKELESQQAMKKRQKEDEIKLKEMEAAKKKQIEDDAAAKLQSVIKRKQTPSLKQSKESVNVIASKAKALLTRKVDAAPYYKLPAPKSIDVRGFIPKTSIRNKFSVGEPLVVNKRQKLVSKKKNKAAVEGYENRLAYLDMASKYKDVMKGKQRKVNEV
jgi:hypothetical protein